MVVSIILYIIHVVTNKPKMAGYYLILVSWRNSPVKKKDSNLNLYLIVLLYFI